MGETKQERWAKYMRNYRAKHPDRVKHARRKQYNNRKRKAMEQCGGAICVRCGCDELDFLEFNHINGDGCKDWRENNGTPMMDRILTSKRETDDIEILCRLCNAHHHLESKNPEQARRLVVTWE